MPERSKDALNKLGHERKGKLRPFKVLKMKD